jgi:hypothetical protein
MSTSQTSLVFILSEAETSFYFTEQIFLFLIFDTFPILLQVLDLEKHVLKTEKVYDGGKLPRHQAQFFNYA